MNKPTAFDMERILAFRLGAKLATDITLQRQDIDLVMGDITISVKKQDAAARTGNISLEVEQIDTRTGDAAPGNFTSCKAKCIIIVIPGARQGVYEAHLWEHATLAKLAAQPGFRRAHLTPERLEANQRRGNKYDDTVSVLIPLAAARKVSNGVRTFDVGETMADPNYQAFARKYPNTQREF